MKLSIYIAFFFLALNIGCSKKVVPVQSAEVTVPKKNTTFKAPKTPAPKVIIVNDSAAKKTFDGKYYYDLGGKRYWRNNKDGKYYLYNKSMNSNEDFKPKTVN